MMHISGTYTILAPPEKVWLNIFDIGLLLSLLPGCKKLEQVNPGEYRGVFQIGLASLSGTYNTIVKLKDVEPQRYCYLEGEVSGANGSICGGANITLQEEKGNSLITYQADGTISGALAKLPPRYIEGAAQSVIKLGFAALNKKIQSSME